MPWTAPRTWVTAEIVTAALMNVHLRDNLLETAPAKVTTAGDIVVATGANAIKRLALGAATRFLRVNAGATDIEWHPLVKADVGLTNVADVLQAPLVAAVNEQTGDDYTLVLTDGNGKLVDMNRASAQTLTVPLNSSVAFAIGTQIAVRQKGAGAVTITPTGGVTLQSADSALTLRAQHSVAGLVKVATDTWVVLGDVVT